MQFRILLCVWLSSVTTNVLSMPNAIEQLVDAIYSHSPKDLCFVQTLLLQAPSLDQYTQRGDTPLAAAVRIGSADLVRLLLAHNPDVSLTTRDGRGILEWDFDQQPQDAATIAIRKGYTQILQLLVTADRQGRLDRTRLLLTAVESLRPSIVEILLKDPALRQHTVYSQALTILTAIEQKHELALTQEDHNNAALIRTLLASHQS